MVHFNMQSARRADINLHRHAGGQAGGSHSSRTLARMHLVAASSSSSTASECARAAADGAGDKAASECGLQNYLMINASLFRSRSQITVGA
jgi:hypothetical protein